MRLRAGHSYYKLPKDLDLMGPCLMSVHARGIGYQLQQWSVRELMEGASSMATAKGRFGGMPLAFAVDVANGKIIVAPPPAKAWLAIFEYSARRAV